MPRSFAVALLCVVCLALPSDAKEKKIRGYVTDVISPTVFQIEDYRVTRDASLTLELTRDEDDDKSPMEFKPEDIRVGTLLEIRGDHHEATGEFRARAIKVILDEDKRIKRTALIEDIPDIGLRDDYWQGTIMVDGQRVTLHPRTDVVFKLSKSEKDEMKKRQKAAGEKPVDDDFSPLRSLSQIGLHTFITYEGLRQPDGTVAAERVEFVRNELEPGEVQIWRQVWPSVRSPNFEKRKPGDLEIAGVGKFKLVPSMEAHQYIYRLGVKMIPTHQKVLPKNNPLKVPFQFFLVQDKTPNAFALPNGTVVVFSGLLEVLENESQLAAVMGHEISHVIQEHTWRQQQYHRKKLTAMRLAGLAAALAGGTAGNSVAAISNLVDGAVRNGHSRSLENQADRGGLKYMTEAGYDAREAPRVWQLMTKKYGDQGSSFFWSSHDNNTTRRSYLMYELRTNYSEVTFNPASKNEAEYQRIVQLVRDATDKTKKK